VFFESAIEFLFGEALDVAVDGEDDVGAWLRGDLEALAQGELVAKAVPLVAESAVGATEQRIEIASRPVRPMLSWPTKPSSWAAMFPSG
jgi:hypothetical protein